MDLTEQQVRYIQEWAERTGVVKTVRLYGSRAKGSARSDSDVNLALTVGTSHYVRILNEWQKELSDALILKVMLKQYNSPADDTVRRYCDEFSVVLFPRQGQKRALTEADIQHLQNHSAGYEQRLAPLGNSGPVAGSGFATKRPRSKAFWNTRSFRGLNQGRWPEFGPQQLQGHRISP